MQFSRHICFHYFCMFLIGSRWQQVYEESRMSDGSCNMFNETLYILNNTGFVFVRERHSFYDSLQFPPHRFFLKAMLGNTFSPYEFELTPSTLNWSFMNPSSHLQPLVAHTCRLPLIFPIWILRRAMPKLRKENKQCPSQAMTCQNESGVTIFLQHLSQLLPQGIVCYWALVFSSIFVVYVSSFYKPSAFIKPQ